MGDDVVDKCISNFKNKAALHTQKGANLGLKCARMRLAAGLRPDPLWELQRSPKPLAALGAGVPTSKGRKGNEWEKGRKGMGRGKGKMGTGGKEGSPCMHSHK